MKACTLLSVITLCLSIGCSTGQDSEAGKERKSIRQYYPNGSLKSIRTVVNDSIPDGPWTEFSESGLPTQRCEFVMGKLEGRCYEFYENGKIKIVTEYKQGMRDGILRLFYLNGMKKVEVSFRNNEYHGDRIKYDSLGRVEEYQFYAFNGLWHYEKDYRTGKESSNLREKYVDIIGLALPESIGDTFHAVLMFARPPLSTYTIRLKKNYDKENREIVQVPLDSGFYHIMKVFDGNDENWSARYVIHDLVSGKKDSATIFLEGYIGYDLVDTISLKVKHE